MPANPPYPLTTAPLGLLDLTPTLLPGIPAAPLELSGTSLPPVAFLLLADCLGELYEMIFPDQPHWLAEEVVTWRSQVEIITAVERFLGRVSTLFPVHDEIWEWEEIVPGQVSEVIEWRLHEIPIMPMGFDYWYEGWDDYKEPAPYLLHLQYSRREDGFFSHQHEFADLYPDHQLPLQVEPHRLVDTLRQMKAQQLLLEPLAGLPDLIEMLDCNTGNMWLDTGELSLADCNGYPRWSAEAVQGLAQEWQEAQPIVDQEYSHEMWGRG